MDGIVRRLVIVTSIAVGMIAYDAWRYRRNLARFARFVAVYDRPAVAVDDAYPARHAPERGDL